MTRHVHFNASSNYATIILCHFGPVKNVDDASKITLKYSSLLRRRAKHVHDASSYVYTLQAFQLCFKGRLDASKNKNIFDELKIFSFISK